MKINGYMEGGYFKFKHIKLFGFIITTKKQIANMRIYDTKIVISPITQDPKGKENGKNR